MLNYKEYEKAVFEWMLNKRQTNPDFNFTVRQIASKGAETDYFIGTERSKYFATTFWIVPVNYPGSSADLINVMFEWDTRGYLYKFQFVQPKEVEGTQNQLALQLVRALKPRVIKVVELRWESPEEQKSEYFSTKSRQPAYSTIDEMMNDVFADYELISPIIEEEIANIKKSNPDFQGGKIQSQQFETFIQKFENRKSKYANLPLQTGAAEFLLVDKNEPKMMTNMAVTPLNQILYGPPGTGKTFYTINHALAIIEDKSIEEIGQEKREDLLARFKHYRDQKQIEFTTFHQSMSYEDFVEGIKPLKPEDKDTFVKYEVRPGIFKTSAARAAYSCYLIHRVKATGKAYDFDMLYDAFIEDISKKLEQNIVPEFYTKTNSKIKVIRINKNDSILATAFDSIRKDGPAPKTRNNFRKLYQKFQSIDEIKTLQDIRDEIKILPGISGFYALFKGLKEFEKSFQPAPDEEEAQDLPNLTDEKIMVQFSEGNFTDAVIAEARQKEKKAEKHVLIIDEINRGNVSQIFGELITLLETDKRMGNREALEVTLPYSKDSFSVPHNLYIIGTMNTADRSVEALDTALRRRFSFVEMPPKTDLPEFEQEIAGFRLSELLGTINRRIEKLLDKDHLIGHSYFLKISSFEDLHNTFYRNIIPLLQEYFFGDFGKIGLVLGAGFVETDKENADFAVFEGYEDASELNERRIYRIKKETGFNEVEFKTALSLLLKEKL